jgi:hypothetical protein
MTGLTTTSANNEAGVKESYIINPEGRILAPVVMAQQVPNNPFITEARKLNREFFQQINDQTIGALVPIIIQNNQGLSQAGAYAVVIYDMSTLAVDDGQTFSLFVQTLVIALLVGALVFFFLYKIILKPITDLNGQVSSALREGHGAISASYQFPELIELSSNIQSLVARGSQGGGFGSVNSYEHERSFEATGLVQLVGFPALAVRRSNQEVLVMNSHFQEQIAKSAKLEPN